MPIMFLTTTETFAEAAWQAGLDAVVSPKNEYAPSPEIKTYYVFPATSLGYMDYFSSEIIGGIEHRLRTCIDNLEYRRNLFGKCYLPIGSCLIFDMDEATMAETVRSRDIRRAVFGGPTDEFSKAPKGVVVAPITLCGAPN